MSAKYLIQCECGQTIPVEVRQAGTTVGCSCGKINSIPPLRQLRELPQASDSTPSPPRPATWGLRQGIALLGGVTAAALAGWGVWLGSRIPPVDTYDNAVREAMQQEFDHALEHATPAQLYRAWVLEYSYLDERGFSQPHIAANQKQWQEQIERLLLQRNVLLGSAAGVGVLALGLWLLLPRTGRQRV